MLLNDLMLLTNLEALSVFEEVVRVGKGTDLRIEAELETALRGWFVEAEDLTWYECLQSVDSKMAKEIVSEFEIGMTEKEVNLEFWEGRDLTRGNEFLVERFEQFLDHLLETDKITESQRCGYELSYYWTRK